MAIETGAAGGALLNFFGIPLAAGSASAVIGYLFMWPKSRREAFVRFACSVFVSGMVSPFLISAVHSWWPSLFDSANVISAMYGIDPTFGVLYVCAPFMVIAGLPAWWILGAVVRWLDKRKDKDIAEIAHDAAEVVRDVRGAM